MGLIHPHDIPPLSKARKQLVADRLGGPQPDLFWLLCEWDHAHAPNEWDMINIHQREHDMKAAQHHLWTHYRGRAIQMVHQVRQLTPEARLRAIQSGFVCELFNEAILDDLWG